MKIHTERLLSLMHILAWIAFIGLLINAGTIIVSYIVSIGNAEAAQNLFRGLDLYEYRQNSMVHYTIIVGYKVSLLVAQAYVAYSIAHLLSSINVSKPFSTDVVKLMQQISYGIVGVWLIAMVHNVYLEVIEKLEGITAVHISGQFIILAGIVFVLAQMFKRGIEIQTENELTI